MQALRFSGSIVLVVMSWLFAGLVAAEANVADLDLRDGIIKDNGIEILRKGPIHEAFALPGNLNSQPMPPVPKQPPPPVAEQPPEQKPPGENVQWIPGYWAWDSGRTDFVWVSGFYRNTPPGRQYVPGYWANTAEGWRWVPGFFASEQQPDVTYVPQPPASLDTGPSVPAPDNNSFYSPGVWVYNGTEFVWRPGFWSPYKTGYVWVDAGYQWTPSGYVFVPGYWDYPLENRGLLFPPVYFSGPIYQQPGYFYTPNYALGMGGLLNNLYYSPNYPFYYFGGYGPGFAGLGFRPWFAGPAFGNPLFNYYRWAHRGNPAWFNGMRQAFANPAGRGLTVTPLNRTAGLVGVPSAQRAAFQTRGQNLQQLAQTRSRLENGLGTQGAAVRSLRFSQGTLKPTVSGGPATGFVNRASTPGFNSPRLAASHPPTSKQGLVGRPPAATHAPAAGTGGLQGYRPGNAFQASASAFQPRSGLVGSPRNPTVNHSPANFGTISPRGYGGSTVFRPSISNYGASSLRPSTSAYRPSVSAYRPSVQAYRPSATTHVPSASYRAPSFSGGRVGGGHVGGGHMGGGHGGHGGHR
jgi:hypothetical protein